jgi:hypothetical protein
MSKGKNSSWVLPIGSCILIFIYGIFQTGCYEPTTDCLDIQATNFNVNADEACVDCCVFPTLGVQIQHLYQVNDSTIRNLSLVDSVYTDGGGNPFRFNQVLFYVSNFRLVRSDGSEVGVIDTIGFDTFDPNTGVEERIVVEDNFLLGNPNVSSLLTVGNINESGNFIGVRFNIGLEGQTNQAIPSSLPVDHPLASQEPTMYFDSDQGYIFTRMELFRDTIATDTIPEVVRIGTAQNLKQIDLPIDFSISEGFDVRFELRLDYTRWFSGISVADDAASGQLPEKIVNNLTEDIFSIIQL